LEDVGIDGRILLKLFIKKQCWMQFAGFIFLKIGKVLDAVYWIYLSQNR